MKIIGNDVSVIRNCSHFTSVQTCILTVDGVAKKTLKKAFSVQGCSSIKSEYEGANLFCKLLQKDLSTYIFDYTNNGKYSELHLKYIDGEIGNCHAGLSSNYDRLVSLIDFFRENEIYKKENFSHGDLSVSNVVFHENLVIWIIDWENYNNFFPNYYDLIYCITEIVLFNFVKRKKKIRKDDVSRYWNLYSKIADLYEIPEEIKLGPSKWLRNNVLRYINLGNAGLHKCPFIKNDVNLIEDLDKALLN